MTVLMWSDTTGVGDTDWDMVGNVLNNLTPTKRAWYEGLFYAWTYATDYTLSALTPDKLHRPHGFDLLTFLCVAAEEDDQGEVFIAFHRKKQAPGAGLYVRFANAESPRGLPVKWPANLAEEPIWRPFRHAEKLTHQLKENNANR